MEKSGIACFFCGKDGSGVKLVRGVTHEGIRPTCLSCSETLSVPVVTTPRVILESQMDNQPEREVVEELRRVRSKEYKEERQLEAQRDREVAVQNEELKKIVEKNFSKKIDQSMPATKPLMVENFHWIVMRARRRKKLSYGQLAAEMKESEAAIKLAEKGVLPDDDRFVDKLELQLGISIRDESYVPPAVSERDALLRRVAKGPARMLDFDRSMLDHLTVDDLRSLREEQSQKRNLKMLTEAETEALEEEMRRKGLS